MNSFVAVDPGLRGCGVAGFAKDGHLAFAVYVKNSEKETRGPRAWVSMAYEIRGACLGFAALHGVPVLLLEVMRINVDRVGRLIEAKDPADVLECQGVQGAVAALMPWDSIGILTKDWKGQLPKRVSNIRSRAALTPQELARVTLPAKSLEHNVWDAIGIGLYYARRLGLRARGT